MTLTKQELELQRKERQGLQKYNNQGLLMTIIKYNSSKDIEIMFEDGYTKNICWKEFDRGTVANNNYEYHGKPQKENRIGLSKLNYQGSLMTIIKYNGANDIIVEFNDDYKAHVHCIWKNFKNGCVKNPNHPSIFGVGIIGDKYPTWNKEKKNHTKEYKTWVGMIERCYIDEPNGKNNAYYNICTVDDKWIYYPNFHDWLHEQENFDRWYNGREWHVDKDILHKGNKIYASDNCLLVPCNINNLVKQNKWNRGEYPIGVTYDFKGHRLIAQCWNPITKKNIHLGEYNNEYDAFVAYKNYKENLIKEVANIEYEKGNITLKCKEALYNFVVDYED